MKRASWRIGYRRWWRSSSRDRHQRPGGLALDTLGTENPRDGSSMSGSQRRLSHCARSTDRVNEKSRWATPKIVVLSPSMDEARPTDRERSLEPRATDLHVQIEQVSVALQQLRHTAIASTIETRLSEMTRDCAAILDGWARNDEKHATAVVELHSRSASGTRSSGGC